MSVVLVCKCLTSTEQLQHTPVYEPTILCVLPSGHLRVFANMGIRACAGKLWGTETGEPLCMSTVGCVQDSFNHCLMPKSNSSAGE